MIAKTRFLPLLLAGCAAGWLWADAGTHWNGGRTVPVHKLAPCDANGDKVSVQDRLPAPISQVKTCGQCHEVAAMRGGSHFRTGLDTNDAPPTVNFEPWFLVNGTNGPVTALSLCGLPGTKSPAEIGMTAWQWTKAFGRTFPGGGIGSDPRAMDEVGGEKSRWFVTGPLEVNCLACHQQTAYDSSEWARQVLRENFRGAATAASGFGDVGGMNERLDDAWDPFISENKDDHLFRVPENVKYDLSKFDSRGRCTFAVGKPKNERCLACHAVTEKGMASHEIQGDVHLQRGMKCVDCHHNGIDHRMKTKSCASCHLEPKGAGPRPVHAGFPTVHFEKLSCTVCHSGVTAGGGLAQVRTARANRIGIYGRAQWATDVPYIVEPVFARCGDGVIRPCRMAWTAPGADPVWWPFAHDVRPARQARGARPVKCADCHTADSSFFFGKIVPVYPDGSRGEPVCQSKFLGADSIYHRFFGMVFMFRPLFKVVLWTVFGILCLFAAAAAAVALRRLCGQIAEGTLDFIWGAFRFVLDAVMVASIAYLAVSGVVGWLCGGMTWWWIVLHMVAGGALAASLALLAFFRQHVRTERTLPAVVWAVWVLFAAGTVFTAVMPMMTVFGMEGQHFLLWSHRCVALTFTVLSGLLCLVTFLRRK
ncbi:MAG: hypothetical protein IKO72_02470 [Kiritimatiellae bacterium]|nr:hypothetical protein [Kiritimatiellia bacterium]